MQLLVFKTLWGHVGDYESAARQAVDANFDGLEGPVPTSPDEVRALESALAHHNLGYIAEICTAGSYVPNRHAGVADHLASLKALIPTARDLGARFVNCIGGCDAWPLDTSLAFFEGALNAAARHGLAISFETHRSRSLFTPWVTDAVLDALPDMKLTCDFSHWCVVCERLLDTESEVLEKVASHAHHIHARVGYDQGPQVPHPAAPEYADALWAHRRWWEQIWACQQSRGYTHSTMTPEFGPDGYLHLQPFSQTPVADLWDINRWMGQSERQHFALARLPRPQSDSID